MWEGSHSPCLGPALGKHTSLFPDSRCLTNVCCWIGQGWPECTAKAPGFSKTGSRGSHTSGKTWKDLPHPAPQSSLNRPEKGQEGRETLGAGRGRQSPWNWDWRWGPLQGLSVGTGGTRKQSQAWVTASVLSEVQFPRLYSEAPCLDLFI